MKVNVNYVLRAAKYEVRLHDYYGDNIFLCTDIHHVLNNLNDILIT